MHIVFFILLRQDNAQKCGQFLRCFVRRDEMVKFIKKHRIGFSLLVVLLIVTSIWLYREYRAQVDRQDWRLFTIPMLSQTSKTSFEYKTDPYVRYYRCFKLVFKYGEILSQFNRYHLIFDNSRYNLSD